MSSHHGFLAAVERDLLAGDAQFPTGLKVLSALRRALDDPDASVGRVTTLVSAEPLVMARLLRLANCATFNPGGVEVLTVERAIQRVGFNMVRTAATAVAVAQMRAAGLAPHFSAIADDAWLRSVQLSVLARLLAPMHPGATADEAGLCALMSELGTFYLLQRASRYPTYSEPSRLAALQELLALDAARITARLAEALGMPATITAALAARHQVDGACTGTAAALRDCLEQSADLLPQVFGAQFAGTVPEAQRAEFAQQARTSLQDLLSALGER